MKNLIAGMTLAGMATACASVVHNPSINAQFYSLNSNVYPGSTDVCYADRDERRFINCNYASDRGDVLVKFRGGNMDSMQVADYLGATQITVDIVPSEHSVRAQRGINLRFTRDYSRFWQETVLPVIMEREKIITHMTVNESAQYRVSSKPKQFFLVVVDGSEMAKYLHNDAIVHVNKIIRPENEIKKEVVK